MSSILSRCPKRSKYWMVYLLTIQAKNIPVTVKTTVSVKPAKLSSDEPPQYVITKPLRLRQDEKQSQFLNGIKLVWILSLPSPRLVALWGLRRKVRGNGQGYVTVRYLTPYFGYFILPSRWLVGVMPFPRKSQKNYTKEKTATDKWRRRFFYTFLYLLGSTTIPWMRESPFKVSKIR